MTVILRNIVVFLLKAYQMLHAPFFHGVCRFEPTCSNYAIEAVKIHGILRGGWLAARRVVKCHPLHPGGFDFVPPAKSHCKHCNNHSHQD